MQAKMNPNACQCFAAGAKVDWIDQAFLAVTDAYWEISRMRCSGCGTLWARAFLEYEAFSRSGRHYRAPVTAAALDRANPEAVLRLIEAAELRIVGGSRFDGVEHLVRGPGKLLEAP
jgi:hypothetical protein